MTVIRRDNKKLFFDRVLPEPNTGCWLWFGSYTKDGYGRLTKEYFNDFSKAHRFSYFIHYGDFDRSLCVCHRCDNPSCVNPDHLFVDTNEANMADMVIKGRSPKGTRNIKAKLTDEKVKEMRRLFSDGMSRKEISSLFGIGKTQTAYILTNKAWNFVQ